jgi:hypothetical protein
MKRSRFSDEQIIGILKEQEAGAVTADVCRRHGAAGRWMRYWRGDQRRCVAHFPGFTAWRHVDQIDFRRPRCP